MVRRLIFCFGMTFIMSLTTPVYAVEKQKIPPILKIVENFLRGETVDFPGRVSFNLGTVDPRLSLPLCPVALEPFTPTGTRLWGQAMVGVRCNGQAGWTIHVPVSIKVMANVVHAIKPLAYGQQVGASDILLQEADLAQLPGGIFTDMDQVVGKTLLSSVAVGQPLRQEILRAPFVIQQGQTVRLQTRGQGFSVSAEGKALTAAAEGQVIQVRINSGRTVSGIARSDGVVEVRP